MRLTISRTLLALCMMFATTAATAQHGLSIDLGKRHQHDSTRVTNFGIGLTNGTDTLKGVQLNALSSVADVAKGVQISGFSNISTSPFRGVQFSGVSNLAMGVERGLQLSMLNVSSGYMRGAQMGVYNYADTLNGSQLGIINVALRHPRGWQVGLINYTRDTIAHKIGLVNVNPNTTIDFMIFGGTSSKFNMALRFRNRSTYNIIGFGTHYMGLDRKFSGALYYRIGQYFRLSPQWSISGDLGFFHVETFQQNYADTPERLFSLQARLNADYQINRTVGAFASVGWGDTRYYSNGSRYRSRLLIEAGITLRYPHNQLRDNAARWEAKQRRETPDSAMTLGLGKKHPWWALAQVTGVNAFVHLFDRYVTNQDFAQTTLNTWKQNFRNGFVWDNDQFSTNLFMHPYHGNLYFNSARSQGLNFWQSAPFSMIGSLQWEFLGEIEPPAINDLIATTFGGICIGEITHRVSRIFLNDSRRGWPRFWREAAATVVNPMGALKRFATGDAWRVRSSHNRYHDYSRNPLDFSISFGDRYLADNGAIFRGEHNPYLNFYLEYGDPINEGDHNAPYDFFDLEATFSLSANQPIINRLHLLGRLWSTPMIAGRKMNAEFGIYQHFDYFDSKPVKDGSDLTPYRISEAAAFGPGVIMQMPRVGILTRLEQRLFVNGILLGGTKSDYYNVIDRDYNMGSGFSAKSKTHLELRNFGRFILHAQFYKIFTWKGYEQKDLSTIDPLHLNAQGDKGNASLFVVNPILELDLRKNWSLLISSSAFMRRTHYKYYDDVKANTFELRLGLTAHL